jgi:hypothetical protein
MRKPADEEDLLYFFAPSVHVTAQFLSTAASSVYLNPCSLFDMVSEERMDIQLHDGSLKIRLTYISPFHTFVTALA